MPYSLSEQQIDFILNDIKVRGIEIEKLQINLLDHVCCLLEENMNQGDDFENCYKQIIEEFHETGLKGLQKETKGVMRSKHYYKFKGILYIIFIGSVTYNIYCGTKYTLQYFDYKKFIAENFLIKEATLESSYKDLNKLLLTNSKIQTKKYKCICFLYSPLHMKEIEGFGYDSTHIKKFNTKASKTYMRMDSLAAVYKEQVTFVAAFQNTDETTEKFIEERKSETKNVIYLHGLNKLLSAYMNSKKINAISMPAVFVFDEKGKVVYDCKYPSEAIFFLSLYFKRLLKK